jgi:hypothetical protein
MVMNFAKLPVLLRPAGPTCVTLAVCIGRFVFWNDRQRSSQGSPQ